MGVVNGTDANQIRLYGIDMMNEMQRQEGNIYILPPNRLQQPHHTLTHLHQKQVVHTEHLLKGKVTKICR